MNAARGYFGELGGVLFFFATAGGGANKLRLEGWGVVARMALEVGAIVRRGTASLGKSKKIELWFWRTLGAAARLMACERSFSAAIRRASIVDFRPL